MLSHMPKAVFNGLAVLTVAIPVMAWSRLPISHARTNSSPMISEYNSSDSSRSISYDYVNGSALFTWQPTSLQGFGLVEGKASTKGGITNEYEFRQVRVTSTDATSINGEWDVFKNGAATCAGCKGYVYVSAPGQGNPYMKGYVNNGPITYYFSGSIDPDSRLYY